MRLHWFRFRVRSVLVLMLLVASVCLGWRVYRNAWYTQLLREVQAARGARDSALQDWKLAGNHRTRGIEAFNKYAACRGQYFASRDALETSLQRLTSHEARPTK